jgi:amidase
MQRFFTGRLDGAQCSGKPMDPIGEVEPGETVVIESALEEKREKLGPLRIKGVKPGDVVSILIEDIHLSRWWGADPDYGIIPEVIDRQRIAPVEFDVPLQEGCLVFPGGITTPFSPMVGMVSLAARERSPNPWDHGGNMDINEIRPGATVYIRAQLEGGLLSLGDLHAYQGDGEISGTALEADGATRVTVDVSDRFPAPRPVIERDGKVMTVGMGRTYWAAVRSAVRDMTYLLMSTRSLTLEQANSVAVKAGSLRNGAIWMMSDHHIMTMVDHDDGVPRTVFLEVPYARSE